MVMTDYADTDFLENLYMSCTPFLVHPWGGIG